MIMGEDLCSEGRGFESQYRNIVDGQFHIYLLLKL